MAEVNKSALVLHTVEQMYALVADFESYPQFVPWVKATQILARGPGHVVGRVQMRRFGWEGTFTTRTLLEPPRRITLVLLEGPFEQFSGEWTFEALGERGCKVSLSVCCEFKAPLVGLLLSRSLDQSCNELVDAFVARARALYGARPQ
jgi:ribosome-associated toxin RatA of RatAB toxin-antitoxin module